MSKAREAGADWLVMCDTNGGSLPHEISDIVTSLTGPLPGAPLGIHTHNDCELAVANTLSAVQAGVRHVQGTMNGYGERCGNANLCSIIPNLQLKLGYECIGDDNLRTLTNTARYISEIANVNMPVNQPYVGNAAFAHKGGIHVSAILRDSRTYEHIEPEKVGNKQRVLVSELAGQSNIVSKAQDMGLDFDPASEQSKHIIGKIKDLEHEGYQFEGADASWSCFFGKRTESSRSCLPLNPSKCWSRSRPDSRSSPKPSSKSTSPASIYTAAEGNGPVNALDNALRKALVQYFPTLKEMHLADYKVRVLDDKDATAAKVRVLIESKNFENAWNTVGVSSNVIEASWEALVDSMRYALLGQISPEQVHESAARQGLVNH